MSDKQNNTGISIIVPFLNEEKGIELFCVALEKYAAKMDYSIELIFVDDGSTDHTVDILKQYQFENINQVQLIKLSRNFGSHAAIRAGLTKAKHAICTWMGSDLQEPLEMLQIAIGKISEGYDAVYIDKSTVKVSKANRVFSKVYTNLIRKYAVPRYSSGGTSTIIFNQKIRDYLNENIESNSSIMLQIIDAGFKSITIPLDYNERIAGESKWTLKKKIKLFIDSFVAFSFAPIRLVSLVGIILFILGIIIGLFVIINKIIAPSMPSGYSTLICILALGFGITNVSLGIVSEYLWRTYDAARGRPCFIIDESVILAKEDV